MKKLISFLFFLTLIMLSMLNFDSEAHGKKVIEVTATIALNVHASR